VHRACVAQTEIRNQLIPQIADSMAVQFSPERIWRRSWSP